VLGLPAAGYAAGLVFHGDGFNLPVDIGLAMLTQWVPVIVCWLAVLRTRFGRIEVLLAAAAVTSNAAADTYYLATLGGNESAPFPSPADIGYLLFYALMLGALAVLVRRQLRGLAWPVLLESAVGSLGAAAVLAVLLSPVLDSAAGGAPSFATAIAVAYPLFDLLLVAAVAAIAASQAREAGRRWILLVLGLLLFAAADVIYALGVPDNLYAVGTVLDEGWAVGLALIALWVDRSARPDRKQRRAKDPHNHSANAAVVLATPTIATAAGLGVLILASQTHVSALAVALASATLALAAVPLAFRQRMLGLLARTDDLTGLRNRRALYADVSARLDAGHGRRSALLLLDLDRFKEVNDSLGHDAGDRLLVEVGVRLSAQLRAGDVLARLGGDEFAILLDGSDHDEAVAVAGRVRASLAETVVLEGITLQTSASIGIALYPDHGHDLAALLGHADKAMYTAKTTRSGHHVYTSTEDILGDTRLRTLQDLRTALRDDQLLVHYQPKVALDTGSVHGVEALVRWNHPSRGLLQPDQFLELAEEAGLMSELTNLVLAKALDQAATWSAQGHPLTVAVNMSSSSLVDADLPDRIAAMLAVRGLSPSALMLEITEDFLIADRHRAGVILTRLRSTGIQIAVDDFGTGYNSLSYLSDLPIDELKLGQSFVLGMIADTRAAALVASTIDLAHSLGLRMVAEGVESAGAYAELARYGCDDAQGLHVSRPVPVAELDTWLAARRDAVVTP